MQLVFGSVEPGAGRLLKNSFYFVPVRGEKQKTVVGWETSFIVWNER